jgi:hypothetical protein
MCPGIWETVAEWAASELFQPRPGHPQHGAEPHNRKTLCSATALVLRCQLIRHATSKPQENSRLADCQEVRKSHTQPGRSGGPNLTRTHVVVERRLFF